MQIKEVQRKRKCFIDIYCKTKHVLKFLFLFSANHLRDIFNRMGFNDQEIVALSGAHALGRCHATASGYVGPWTPTPNSFNNLYFSLLKGKLTSITCRFDISVC